MGVSDRFPDIHRKNPSGQVPDRIWAKSMMELPYKENVEGSVE